MFESDRLSVQLSNIGFTIPIPTSMRRKDEYLGSFYLDMNNTIRT